MGETATGVSNVGALLRMMEQAVDTLERAKHEAEIEVDRLARINGDQCDEIHALREQVDAKDALIEELAKRLADRSAA